MRGTVKTETGFEIIPGLWANGKRYPWALYGPDNRFIGFHNSLAEAKADINRFSRPVHLESEH
jgi:hypothetical protein